MKESQGSHDSLGKLGRASLVSRTALQASADLVPSSGDVDELVAAVAIHRGRRIAVLACDLPPDAPSGLWLQTGDADYIVHAQSITAEHREVIVCHEVAHMLLGHRPRDGEVDAAAIAPSISPDVAARFFTRHGYEDDAEVEAETLATLLATELAAKAEAVRTALAQTHDNVSTRLR